MIRFDLFDGERQSKSDEEIEKKFQCWFWAWLPKYPIYPHLKHKSFPQKMNFVWCVYWTLTCKKNHEESNELTQPAITCSKLTIETLEQGVKYAQSYTLF